MSQPAPSTPAWSNPIRRVLRRSAMGLVLGALLGCVAAFGQMHVWRGPDGPLADVDTAIQDLILAARPPDSYLSPGSAGSTTRDPRSFITIVAIDERTISELGAYNGGYPRAYHAQVIDALLDAPPRVIAVDLGFFEPTADDALLAAALDRARGMAAPTSVVLAAAGLDRGPDTEVAAGNRFRRALVPTPLLAERADIAVANVLPDDRGTIRLMPLMLDVGGVERPTLGLAAIARYLRRSPTLERAPTGDNVEFAGRVIPVTAERAARINFFGPPSRAYAADDTFRVVSFVDVLRGRVDPMVWRGGLVFVGALGATGLADDYWTPLSQQGRKMAGVEIHANVAATLFSTNFLRDLSAPTQVALVVGLAVLMGLLAANLDLLLLGIVSPLVLLGFAAVAAWGLYADGLFVPITAPLLAGIGASLSTATPRAVRAHRRAARLAATLAAERADAAYQARHDGLTGLPNRAWLLDELRQTVLAEQQRQGSGALLLLNIDRFKDVNDALGHARGDSLLAEVSRRVREVDLGARACVARVEADAFAVVLPDANAAAAASASVVLLRALELPFEIDGDELTITASVGIVVFPEHGSEPELLLQRADAAVQRAKERRSGYATYAGPRDDASSERLMLVASLRRAVTADELSLFCQPKIDCQTGELVGVEALVRWQHPERGTVSPDQFIPLAENTGLIRPVTQWVLRAAVRHVRDWIDAGVSMRAAVNLSTHDLQDLELPNFIAQLLNEAQLPAELFTVEITETALLADPVRAQTVLERICALGVGASLDDFGTGYSSLTYLKQFPLAELKIDRSFVHDLMRGPRDREIVRSTIELGHRLGLVVVAEGVEDRSTLELLRELGCDLAQGYHLGRPMPADELPEWMRVRAVQGSALAPAA